MSMKDSPFFNQALLMLRVMPHVAAEQCFAIKGGTAINLFVQDMPRLSVDIDLTYVPIEPRNKSLKNISNALGRIAGAIRRILPGTEVHESSPRGSSRTAKLFVSNPTARVVIEPNEVIRGTLFPCEDHDLVPAAEELFQLSVSARTLSVAELYGGKICAALDRQHPRDIYDVSPLLKTDRLPDNVRKAFVIHLASHNRPMHELLAPVRRDFHQACYNEFLGMVREPLGYDDLMNAREKLIQTANLSLSDAERQFLISIKSGEPEWRLLDIPGIEKLPALHWKLDNVRRMEKAKHAEALALLKERLGC